MKYVDEINMRYGGEGTKLYSTAATRLSARMHPIHVRNASYRLDEAEANGWRRFAMIWCFQSVS